MARNLEREAFLALTRWPGRITAQEAGWALGFSRPDILALEKSGQLKSLGRPANNSDRYYAAQQIEDLRADADWLAKATDAMRRHWRQRNADKPVHAVTENEAD
jgi:hypothetical protein